MKKVKAVSKPEPKLTCTYCGDEIREDSLCDYCVECSILARRVDLPKLASFIKKVIKNMK